ncbi:hypothetical protein FQN53_006309 [Emmonsiellopsis sp. PD_33]|nr:hypothetical protein FQN53_006309 [Emmonsiellopsis sp. PD_33]
MHRVHPPRSPFAGPEPAAMPKARTVPIALDSPDPMDLSPPASSVSASVAASMRPPLPSPDADPSSHSNGVHATANANATPSVSISVSAAAPAPAPASGSASGDGHSHPPIGAAAAAQQPKVVQTAFIHKLYSMLQDPSIQHLISWSSTNESFVMSPSQDFSKVLAQYFKHTNVSSFVRQLNMYGFHKVSDVFHTGSPDSQMWEFKHGNGNFKKGDVAGLREIKRRASRQTLIHRDSFSAHKPNPSQPGTPAEPLPDGPDGRLVNLEHSVFDMHARMSRMEESHTLLSARCQALTESLVRCHQWTNSMSHFIMSLVPDPENAIHRDVANMQREVARQLDVVRALESPHEALLSGRQPYFSNMTLDSGPPLSPRQMAQDDSRRPSMIRPPVPSHLSASPRRYGSIGAANSSPNYNRPQIPPQQPMPHPLSSVSAPGLNLGRRHTSADIREHGWGNSAPSPFGPGNASSQWPSSPHRTGHANAPVHPPPSASDQQVRDVLAQYEMGGPRRQRDISRHPTPPMAVDPVAPPPSSSSTLNPESGWSIGGPKFPRAADSSLPATRRSSMASNVHSLLNPTATAERPEEEDMAGEDRKRKRLQ